MIFYLVRLLFSAFLFVLIFLFVKSIRRQRFIKKLAVWFLIFFLSSCIPAESFFGLSFETPEQVYRYYYYIPNDQIALQVDGNHSSLLFIHRGNKRISVLTQKTETGFQNATVISDAPLELTAVSLDDVWVSVRQYRDTDDYYLDFTFDEKPTTITDSCHSVFIAYASPKTEQVFYCIPLSAKDPNYWFAVDGMKYYPFAEIS